ncbi:PP2C family protein-serine/threonine phosphatase [Aquihabitans sp. McL0605]|uniref:PP2C family protein-serine/threonine phosphatase n=1 Tax=Aquihabitans sp. McL0605 TaxID=3415671 RepID=UPI003CEB220C
MTEPSSPDASPDVAGPPDLGSALAALITRTSDLPVSELTTVVELTGIAMGATSARMLVADYGLTTLRELGHDGHLGPRESIEGTLSGHCFATGKIITAPEGEATVCVPLTEGSERLGVLELVHADWTDERAQTAASIVRVLVLTLISKRRYTDVFLRGRRAEPLSIAAEIQWALLPPLACSTSTVSVSGILEPAYSIGGDCFDYAINPERAEFAIIDAVGHGISAVSIAVLALNALRNSRREMQGMEKAYLEAGALIRSQVGDGAFATAQIGSLELDTGELTWLNAGHPLPLLVRDGSFIGELACRPSRPMGFGGPVEEVASCQLQPGDRVLFYTDGVTESRSPDGELFGVERLADLAVRACTERTSPAETIRRLAASVLAYTSEPLHDDATLFMVEYHGHA